MSVAIARSSLLTATLKGTVWQWHFACCAHIGSYASFHWCTNQQIWPRSTIASWRCCNGAAMRHATTQTHVMYCQWLTRQKIANTGKERESRHTLQIRPLPNLPSRVSETHSATAVIAARGKQDPEGTMFDVDDLCNHPLSCSCHNR
jgi:hypothetical protein